MVVANGENGWHVACGMAAKKGNPEAFDLCHVFVDVPWAMWQAWQARMSLRTFVPGPLLLPGTQYIGHTASYYVAN